MSTLPSTTNPFGPNTPNLYNIFQPGFLERKFQQALRPKLIYRMFADKEEFPGQIGESLTKTRVGFLTPNTNSLNPATNIDINNGITPQVETNEQYSASVYQYPQATSPVNVLGDEASIAKTFVQNIINLGVAMGQTINRVAQNYLFSAYMSGQTQITATATATTTISVNDIRGFTSVIYQAQVTPVSVSTPLSVIVNGVVNTVVGYTIDVTNTSSLINVGNLYTGSAQGALRGNEGGVSGTLTLGTAVTQAIGAEVYSAYSPTILRPNGKTNTGQLVSTDKLSFELLLAGVAQLRSNGIPEFDDGYYHAAVSPQSMIQLFSDTRFDLLTRGRGTDDKNWKKAYISNTVGIIFHETTDAFVQPLSSLFIQRPILVGKQVLVEEQFNRGLDAIRSLSASSGIGQIRNAQLEDDASGAYLYVRPPLDLLGQILSQTANWVGGYAVPTDITSTTSVMRTGNNALFKRAVVFETA